MRHLMIGFLIVALAGAMAACQSHAAATDSIQKSPVSRDQVISRAVDYLLAAKRHDNWESNKDWPEAGRQNGGETALVLYALLRAGAETGDPRLAPDSAQLAPSVAWLIHADTQTVYATALKVLVLCHVTSTPDRMKDISKDAGLLIRALGNDGGYSYGLLRIPTQVSDSSNSDYAAMAVLAAGKRGVQVPDGYWTAVIKFWRTRQNPDGGWGYAPPELHPQSNIAMTAGAVADLCALMNSMDARKPVHSGIGYLDQNHAPGSSDYYHMFNLKRAAGCMLNGGAMADAVDAQLLRTQNPDGSWSTEHMSFWGQPDHQISTSYALLALLKQ